LIDELLHRAQQGPVVLRGDAELSDQHGTQSAGPLLDREAPDDGIPGILRGSAHKLTASGVAGYVGTARSDHAPDDPLACRKTLDVFERVGLTQGYKLFSFAD